jgi:hypothetical protein
LIYIYIYIYIYIKRDLTIYICAIYIYIYIVEDIAMVTCKKQKGIFRENIIAALNLPCLQIFYFPSPPNSAVSMFLQIHVSLQTMGLVQMMRGARRRGRVWGGGKAE